jgi:hypothetical protein
MMSLVQLTTVVVHYIGEGVLQASVCYTNRFHVSVTSLCFLGIDGCRNKLLHQQLLHGEKNQTYLRQYLETSDCCQNILKYFGMLLYATLYPLTSCRVCSCWDYPTLLPWTLKMTKGCFMQISSMSHFNNNYDIERMANDLLHKVWALLEILKCTLRENSPCATPSPFTHVTRC